MDPQPGSSRRDQEQQMICDAASRAKAKTSGTPMGSRRGCPKVEVPPRRRKAEACTQQQPKEPVAAKGKAGKDSLQAFPCSVSSVLSRMR